MTCKSSHTVLCITALLCAALAFAASGTSFVYIDGTVYQSLSINGPHFYNLPVWDRSIQLGYFLVRQCDTNLYQHPGQKSCQSIFYKAGHNNQFVCSLDGSNVIDDPSMFHVAAALCLDAGISSVMAFACILLVDRSKCLKKLAIVGLMVATASCSVSCWMTVGFRNALSCQLSTTLQSGGITNGYGPSLILQFILVPLLCGTLFCTCLLTTSENPDMQALIQYAQGKKELKNENGSSSNLKFDVSENLLNEDLIHIEIEYHQGGRPYVATPLPEQAV